MISNNCLIVNLCSGPGCGKSTGAAYIFSKLKMLGINCELTTEFAKGKTWEMNKKALSCQPYLFGEQCWKIDRCIDSVSVIITDSPLFLNAVYNPDIEIEPEFSQMVLKKFNTYNNMNFLLKRQWDYQNFGRNQTVDEARVLDDKIRDFLDNNSIHYTMIDSSNIGYDMVIDMILDKLKSQI